MGNNEFLELNRTISKVYATERGIFHSTGVEADDLPEDLQGGSLIEVDVVHAVQMANAGGELLVLHFNVPKAKDQGEDEQKYTNKTTVTTDGNDNQIQSGKMSETFLAKGNAMKSKFGVEKNT